MSHAILRCADLTICYGQRPAVHHLTVDLPCGALVGIVGPNGAGKSTLLQGILGWLPWSTGRVTLDGKPVLACRGRVSYLAQRRTQDQDFPADVESVVAMGRYSRRGLFRGFTRDDQDAIDQAMVEMGIDHLRSRPFAQLSGGQQQRVFIARALVTGADVLLLDEPLTGLDEPSTHDLMARLQEWARRDRLVIAVIHDLHAVQAWCTHTLLLHRELIAFGPTAETLTESNRIRCYAGPSA
jgi:manganese/zinc/iron transport system ATP- binding protein